MLPRAREEAISRATLAMHNTEADCWVAVHGAVFDVTTFLFAHPGGSAALSKKGRAGCDVTSHFERIGHSTEARRVLSGFRIGTLIDDGERDDGGHGEEALAADDAHRYAVEWHARRRRAMLRAHPELAELAGHNPFTPLIGVFAGVVHALACIYACGLSVPAAFLLAYTVGAWCKMMQFAVCHEVCHGVAGELFRPLLPKHIALSLLTLPSVGGETHHYYSMQHIGHHACLGEWPTSAGSASGDDGEPTLPASGGSDACQRKSGKSWQSGPGRAVGDGDRAGDSRQDSLAAGEKNGDNDVAYGSPADATAHEALSVASTTDAMPQGQNAAGHAVGRRAPLSADLGDADERLEGCEATSDRTSMVRPSAALLEAQVAQQLRCALLSAR